MKLYWIFKSFLQRVFKVIKETTRTKQNKAHTSVCECVFAYLISDLRSENRKLRAHLRDDDDYDDDDDDYKDDFIFIF